MIFSCARHQLHVFLRLSSVVCFPTLAKFHVSFRVVIDHNVIGICCDSLHETAVVLALRLSPNTKLLGPNKDIREIKKP